MAKGLERFTVWLARYPYMLLSGSVGLFVGVMVMLPFGIELPDPTATLLGAIIGAIAVVGASLWAAGAKQRGEEAAAARLRRDSEEYAARLMAIEVTQAVIPLKNEVSEAKKAHRNADMLFLAGNAQILLNNLRLPHAGRMPIGGVLLQLPRDLGLAIAEVNFLTGSYYGLIDNLYYENGEATKDQMDQFKGLPLRNQLEQIEKAIDRVVQLIKPYLSQIASAALTSTREITAVGD